MLSSGLVAPGIYPMPIGTAGICAVDVRDIAEAAAISLAADGHDGQTYDLKRTFGNLCMTDSKQPAFDPHAFLLNAG
jgi:hypothetical protein